MYLLVRHSAKLPTMLSKPTRFTTFKAKNLLIHDYWLLKKLPKFASLLIFIYQSKKFLQCVIMVTNIKTKHYVVDSSVVMAYLMDDEKILPEHEEVITRHIHHRLTLIAPLILPFEIGNSLKSASLSKRITTQQAQELFQQFFKLEINLKPTNYSSSINCAIINNLSFYDASYLTLSTKTKCPLLTLDKKLANLAKRE